MNKFKSMTLKEKTEYIAIIARYLFFALFSWLGKSLMLFGKKKRQITAIVLSFAMILTMIPVMSSTALASTTYSTWAEVGLAAEEGTDYTVSGDTYTIFTAKGLAWVAKETDNQNTFEGKTINLANDIDLNCGLVADYDGDFDTKITASNSWLPIGGKTSSSYGNKYFSGTFDGKGYTVSAVYINNKDNNNYTGLFSYAKNATIKNVYVDKGIVVGQRFVGGIVGMVTNIDKLANVINCSSNNILTKGDSAVGGVVGGKGLISGCYNSGPISGTNEIGGVVGVVWSGDKISNCVNVGTVSASGLYSGGVLGANNNGDVSDLYSLKGLVAGAVNNFGSSADKYAGHLIGWGASSTGSSDQYGAATINQSGDYVIAGDTKNLTVSEVNEGETIEWSVNGGTSSTTIDQSGKLKIDENETATEIHVTAKIIKDNKVIGFSTATFEVTQHVHTPNADDGNCETAITCSVCQKEVTAAKSHDWSTEWEKDMANHWHICQNANCTVQNAVANHNYAIKGVETPATYFADGQRTDNCECGATTLVVLPKLVDNDAPTGTIKIGTNNWNSLLNNITFGLFFEETQTVIVTADDNGKSGVDKTYYYLADAKVTDFTNVNWTVFNGSFSIDPNNKYVVYVKITDKVGNSTIISSDGIVLDNIVPQINVVGGKTYCQAVEATVSDDNLDTVTLNGEQVTLTDGKFTVSPKAGEQVIVVTDKAGNKITVTITVNDSHTWDDGKVTKEPTAEAEGVKVYTCKSDGETKTQTITKLAPTMIEGKDSIYTQGGTDGITFKSDAALADLLSVSVDGVIIDSSNYTTAEGSTIVTLNVDYLATLSVGKHTLDIKSASGTASAEFSIEVKVIKPTDTTKPDANSPQTSDTNNIIFWTCLLLVFGGALSAFGISKTYKNNRKKHLV